MTHSKNFEVLSRSQLAETILFNIENIEVKFKGTNKTAIFERHYSQAETIIIIPKIDDQLIFIQEWCAGIEDYAIKFPTGRVKEGENPKSAANRELMEEIGHGASSIEKIGEIADHPGHSNSLTKVFLAQELSEDRREGDEPEELKIAMMRYVDAVDLILSGKIKDARSIASLFFLFSLKSFK